MTSNEDLARAAVVSVLKMMLIKWTVIFLMNRAAKRYLK